MKVTLLMVALLTTASQAFAGPCGSVSSVLLTEEAVAVNFYTLGGSKGGQAMLPLTSSNLQLVTPHVGNKNVLVCLDSNEKSIISVQAKDQFPQ